MNNAPQHGNSGDNGRRRPGKLAGILATSLTALSVIPVIIWLFSFFGDYSFLSEMLVNFQLQILAVMIPFPFLIALTRRYCVAGVLLLITGTCAFPVVRAWVPAWQPPAGDKSVRLMTFNVLAPNQHFDKVIEEVQRFDPDILIIAEMSEAWKLRLDTLAEVYRWQAIQPRSHGYGIGVYSKFPITRQESMQLSLKWTMNLADVPAIDTTIDVDGTDLRVLAAHFTSPVSPQRLPMRNDQIQEIAEKTGGATSATILAGDFNCTPFSNQFRRLCQVTGLRDSRIGFGYQGSFPDKPLVLRIPIDHALVSPDIHVSNRQTGDACGSDHLPVILDFSISPENRR